MAAIRLNPDIRGVLIGGREFKISLYADDLLLTLTNLHVTLPNLTSQLCAFGALSGYKVNTSKIEALPVKFLVTTWIGSVLNFCINGR